MSSIPFRHCWCYSIWLRSHSNWNSNCVQRSNHEIVYHWISHFYDRIASYMQILIHIYICFVQCTAYSGYVICLFHIKYAYVCKQLCLILVVLDLILLLMQHQHQQQQQWFLCSCCCCCFHSDFEWQKTVFGDWICWSPAHSIRTIAQICSTHCCRSVCVCVSVCVYVVCMVSHSKWIMCVDKINGFYMWLETTEKANARARAHAHTHAHIRMQCQ